MECFVALFGFSVKGSKLCDLEDHGFQRYSSKGIGIGNSNSNSCVCLVSFKLGIGNLSKLIGIEVSKITISPKPVGLDESIIGIVSLISLDCNSAFSRSARLQSSPAEVPTSALTDLLSSTPTTVLLHVGRIRCQFLAT